MIHNNNICEGKEEKEDGAWWDPWMVVVEWRWRGG